MDDPAYAEPLRDMTRRLDVWLEEIGDPSLDGSLDGDDLSAAVAEYRRRYERKKPSIKAEERDTPIGLSQSRLGAQSNPLL